MSRIAALVRLRHRQRSTGSYQRAPSTADSPLITQFRRLLGGSFQEPGAASVCRFAEIIGVVLDGDAPSAPAGIPTCRNAAFVSAPAGIFLSSHRRAAGLIRFRLRYSLSRPMLALNSELQRNCITAAVVLGAWF